MRVPENIKDTVFPFYSHDELPTKWGRWPNGYYVFSSKDKKMGIDFQANIMPHWNKKGFKAHAELIVNKEPPKTAQIKNHKYTFNIEYALNGLELSEEEKEEYERQCIESIVEDMNAILTSIDPIIK